jgi:hypothetical protein
MQIDAHVREAILAQPAPAWTPTVDAGSQTWDGAEVAELTGWVDLQTWPPGTGRPAAARTPPRCAAALTTTATASRCS